MALKPLFLLLLWNLTLCVHGITSLCNVTCSTNFKDSLNCSCSGSVPTHTVLIEVTCRDLGDEVQGSCEVKAPQSWCTIYQKELHDIASVDTNCTATVHQQGEGVPAPESSSWLLCNVVKPPPPVDVRVTNSDGFYNVTWDHSKQKDCLKYTVRIRESEDLSKAPAHYLPVKQKYILLDHEQLKPHVHYTVDAQAKFCDSNFHLGPWSEWSSSADWRTRGTSAEIEEINICWWYYVLPVVLVLVLLLGYSQKPWWQKKLQQISYIPKANEFFKPLYSSHGGNFKEWVKPVFNEYDYLRVNAHAQVMSEKQHDVLQWNNEKQSYGEDDVKQSGRFLHALQPQSNSLLFYQDGGSSQGTGHSTGHISIHTVTLSGEEESEEEGVSQSSAHTLRSYQDEGSFGSFGEDNRENAGYDLEDPHRQNGILAQHENQISDDLSVENINFQPRAQLNEPERVSLNSFVSNEQSEDGYPHVDLDTIDSGFGECSSPGASDSNIAEQMDSDLFNEHKSSNSNYVKQWMICSTIQEDCSNSESEVHET